MALKITYKIRTSKKLTNKSEQEVSISFRLTDGSKADVTLATPFSVPYKYWDSRRGDIKDNVVSNDKAIIDRLQETSMRLSGLKEFLVREYYKRPDFTKDDAKEVIALYLDSLRTRAEDAPPSITEYVDLLISKMRSGMKRIGGEEYTTGTIKAWNSFSKLMKEFCEDFYELHQREFEWADLNRDGTMQFISYLEKMQYLNTTINKYIKDLNATIAAITEEGLLGTLTITKRCPKKIVREDDQTTKVYLTEEELQALYEMPIREESEYCRVRDLFLCGAYTGQRVSDYNNLSGENFKKSPKGYDIVCLTQEKTNTTVVIPVLNNNLLAIARKYSFSFPRVTEQVLNRYIKEICKELSKQMPSLAELYPTQVTMKDLAKERGGKVSFMRNDDGVVFRPKYDLITSHTARRSCITNLFLQGKFTNQQIMSISGHKDERIFLKYIVCSGITIAEHLIEINNGKSNEELF